MIYWSFTRHIYKTEGSFDNNERQSNEKNSWNYPINF